IMKACNRSLRVIAFDEPTASLSDKEIVSLYKVIRRLKQEGKIIIYVSHRMKEIFEISDRIIVFKDGKFVDNVATEQVDENELVQLMVGRDLGDVFKNLDRCTTHGDYILEVNQLKSDYITDISFKLRAGEILGFAGLVGAGRSETAQAIFGADQVHGGSIHFEGKPVKITSPGKAIEMGIALCPEDRKTQGLVLQRSVKENFSMPIINRFVGKIFINHSLEKKTCLEGINALSVKTPSIDQSVIKLSGGNQQKIIIARWLASKPKILILDEPTKGIDVGAKAEIYKLICNIAKQGIGVILISSELPELIGLSDRIIVMGQGEIKGELQRHEANEARILKYAMDGM
ncbi:MAG: sugar ABC transporter ATP-binding protein, partial [Vallitaleaceae bacterium]|nr:sugar ABC transporter ATP-binding protein [Vallitaleaceae bacterium]